MNAIHCDPSGTHCELDETEVRWEGGRGGGREGGRKCSNSVYMCI